MPPVDAEIDRVEQRLLHRPLSGKSASASRAMAP